MAFWKLRENGVQLTKGPSRGTVHSIWMNQYCTIFGAMNMGFPGQFCGWVPKFQAKTRSQGKYRSWDCRLFGGRYHSPRSA